MDYTQFVLTIIAVAMCGILYEMHYFITWICNSLRVVPLDDDDDDEDDEPSTRSQTWRKR